MNEDYTSKNYKLTQYSTQPNQFKQYTTSAQIRTGSNVPEKQVKQSARSNYSIKNLPIIYDQSRNKTPSKRSSRLIYQNQSSQKQFNTSPVVKYQNLSFNHINQNLQINQNIPENIRNSLKQDYRQRKTQYVNSSYAVNQINLPTDFSPDLNINHRNQFKVSSNYVQAQDLTKNNQHQFSNNYKIQKNFNTYDNLKILNVENKVQNIQKSNSRLLIQKPSSFSQHANLGYSISNTKFNNNNYRITENFPHQSIGIPPNNHIIPTTTAPNLKSLPAQVISNVNTVPQNYIYSTIQHPIGLQTSHITSNHTPNNKFNNNPAFLGQSTSNKQLNINRLPQNMKQGPNSIVSHLSMETIPRIQFEKCINQCKNWQTKYNELYLKFMNLATTVSQPNAGQFQLLRQQNYRLKKQLQQQSQKNLVGMPHLQKKFAEMVNQQKQDTIRQCMLLIQRFKLEMRQNKFN